MWMQGAPRAPGEQRQEDIWRGCGLVCVLHLFLPTSPAWDSFLLLPSATASGIKYKLTQNRHSQSSWSEHPVEGDPFLRISVRAKLTTRTLLTCSKIFQGRQNRSRLVRFWSPWLLSFLSKCLLPRSAYCFLHSKVGTGGKRDQVQISQESAAGGRMNACRWKL